MGIFGSIKGAALNQVVKYMTKSEKNIDKIANLLKFFTKDSERKKVIENLKTDTIFKPVMSRLGKLAPEVRKKLTKNFIIGYLIQGYERRNAYHKKYGIYPPSIFVVSPTMRCNLRCTGCYAGEYTVKDDMPYETVKKTLDEAREFGLTFLTISGGEPFVWPHLFRMAKEYPDIYFQIYTNGTMITDSVAKKMAKLGNLVPAISVEGFRKETDQRRGKGVYDRVIRAMANLRKHGCAFGFSAVPTRYNSDVISTDKFLQFYQKQGCLFGWFFTYVPIGLKPNTKLMQTPQQRTVLRKKVHKWRSNPNVKIFIGDFWNDGPFVHGCIAGATQDKTLGGGYMHVNAHGNIEPCVFVHFYVDNIKTTTLKKAIQSKFFEELRKGQKKIKNWLTPCCIIDNPEVLRNAVKKGKAKPSHPGAATIVNDPKLKKFLDKYAKDMQKMTKEDWNRKYRFICDGKAI
ncbi:MAG: radical SAM protein [archaeon]|nr:MAG: radical SAM protein [archaeon]